MLTASWWKGSGYEGLTDGIKNVDNAVGRFSTITSASAIMDATIDLGSVYELYDLTFWLYDTGSNNLANTVGKDLLIQVYYNGTWTDVVICNTNTESINHLVSANGEYNDYLTFNLNGEKAEKIRFYISAASSTSGISFEEITCTGANVGV